MTGTATIPDLPLKFLLDENIPPCLGEALTATGCEVRRVSDFAPRSPNQTVLASATEEGEVLVTADKDFGDLVCFRGQAFQGVVLVRVHPISDHVELIVTALADHAEELRGGFMVIDAQRVRIRRANPRRAAG